MQLHNPDLLQSSAFINNKPVIASGNKRFSVTNPATGSVIAEVTDCGITETNTAIEAAHFAFGTWCTTTAKDRSVLLTRWFNLVMDNKHDLARLMTLEQGKPLKEAEAEIVYGASFIEWFAAEGRRTYGDIIPTPAGNKRLLTIKQPVGVVAAITPWNFPVSMITRKIAPALAAGCTVVIKPPSETPLCALALTQLAIQAGFPKGVVNTIPTSQSKEVGGILTTHSLIKKLSFTGSTAVGKLLMQQCAGTLKRLSLELGGNAPTIVFDDADLIMAVEATIASKYRNAGQTCVCTNRILVQDGVYDRFMQLYHEANSQLKVGNGFDDGVQIGPLISQKAVEKIEHLLRDAVAHGGKVTAGGKRLKPNSLYYEPTIVEKCNAGMAMHEEEIFGPVSAIYTFNTEAEAIAMANNTVYGLAAYFFSNNINRVIRVAEALQYGMIGINEGIISHAEAPFGGVKESGMGREGSKYGIEEYLETKYLCIGGL